MDRFYEIILFITLLFALPLVPCVVIHWIFPNSAIKLVIPRKQAPRTGGSPISNVPSIVPPYELNASGPIAAYVFLLIVFSGLAQMDLTNILAYIAIDPLWKIYGIVQLKDSQGKIIQDLKVKEQIAILSTLPNVLGDEGEVVFKVDQDVVKHSMLTIGQNSSQQAGKWSKYTIDLRDIDLTKYENDSKYEVDPIQQTIKIKDISLFCRIPAACGTFAQN